MMRVTRAQVAEVLNCLLIGWAMIEAPEALDMPPTTDRGVTRLADKGYGPVLLLPNGAEVYRYKDRTGQPAYAIMGHTSHGRELQEVQALLPNQ